VSLCIVVNCTDTGSPLTAKCRIVRVKIFLGIVSKRVVWMYRYDNVIWNKIFCAVAKLIWKFPGKWMLSFVVFWHFRHVWNTFHYPSAFESLFTVSWSVTLDCVSKTEQYNVNMDYIVQWVQPLIRQPSWSFCLPC